STAHTSRSSANSAGAQCDPHDGERALDRRRAAQVEPKGVARASTRGLATRTVRLASTTVRRLFALLLAIGLGCTATGPSPAPSASVSALADDRIQLLHTDDIHGHLDYDTVKSGTNSFNQGGMATLAAQVSALRARAPQRTLLVDGGAAWPGPFISNADKGEAITKAMSLMRYDAMAVGNHDLDWGQDVLAQRAKEATFPFLGANVVDASGKIPAYLTPYVVRDVG